MSINELKEQIFEINGLQVDWNDEQSALAQVEAEAQAVVSDLVESELLTVINGEKLVSDLIESYA